MAVWIWIVIIIFVIAAIATAAKVDFEIVLAFTALAIVGVIVAGLIILSIAAKKQREKDQIFIDQQIKWFNENGFQNAKFIGEIKSCKFYSDGGGKIGYIYFGVKRRWFC